jgi:predicted ribosome quality control (RQC) complex YloA/Tae2 family protein
VREFEGVPGGDWLARAYEFYKAARQGVALKGLLARATAQLQARLTRLLKIRGQMESSLAESAKLEQIRAQAEELKAHLYELPQGHKARELNGIALDKRYTVAENVTRMFARCKKLGRTRKEVEARLVGIEEESKRITGAVAKLRSFAGDYPELLKLATSLGVSLEEEGLPGAKKPKKEEKRWGELAQKGVRRFQSKEGLAIWVGRNHKENEELVIRLARGNDLWLHLKGRPGAHVVVQLPSGKSPSLETLLDAATLAAYYSGVSDKEKVEIDYTYRKHVKRVPGVGGEKFLVTYTQNKTLMLKMEDERLWRLLKQH